MVINETYTDEGFRGKKLWSVGQRSRLHNLYEFFWGVSRQGTLAILLLQMILS